MSFGEGNLRESVEALRAENAALRKLVKEMAEYIENCSTPEVDSDCFIISCSNLRDSMEEPSCNACNSFKAKLQDFGIAERHV